MKELERKSRAAAEVEDTQTDITGSTSGTWAPLFFRVSPALPRWRPGVLAVVSRRACAVFGFLPRAQFTSCHHCEQCGTA